MEHEQVLQDEQGDERSPRVDGGLPRAVAETEEQQGPKDQAGAHCLYLQGRAEGWGTVPWQQQAAPAPAGLWPFSWTGGVMCWALPHAFALVVQFRGNADANFT